MRMRLLFMGRKETAKEEKRNGTADEDEEEELLIESERKVSAVPGQRPDNLGQSRQIWIFEN